MIRETLSISSLGVAFIIFSIGIPLVQSQIDRKAARYEDWRFHAQQAILKHSSMTDKYDAGHFLDLILNGKVLNQKNTKTVLEIQDRLMTRCQELLASSIMLFSSNPEGEIEKDKEKYERLLNTDMEQLMKIDKELTNKPIPAATNIQKDMLFWSKIRRWLYAIGGIFFLGGTMLQILSRH